MSLALVLLGGALGALTRWSIGLAVTRRAHPAAGTVVVNAAGAYVLGWLTASSAGVDARLLLGTGFCGALTTFSAFSFDVAAFGQRRSWVSAGLVLALHLTVCLGACWLGAALGS